jgi:hypothetical protein
MAPHPRADQLGKPTTKEEREAILSATARAATPPA